MPQSNQQIAALLAAKIAEQVRRGAGKGLDAARVFLTSRVREAVSVPAPRRRIVGHMGMYYVATTRALPGAPPRKLSGKLRQSIWSKMIGPLKAEIGANARGYPSRSNSRGANYPAILETTTNASRRHAFIIPTIRKYNTELRSIIGAQLRVSLGR